MLIAIKNPQKKIFGKLPHGKVLSNKFVVSAYYGRITISTYIYERNNMSTNFTKLFSSIIASTVWSESVHTKVVWITMLAMCDRHGRVHSSIPGLAHMAHVTTDECRIALRRFLSPDPDSRTPDYEGKRIEEIDGGWRLLNHAKYRDLEDQESQRISKRDWATKERARKKAEKLANEANRPVILHNPTVISYHSHDNEDKF